MKDEATELLNILRGLDKKIVTVFLTVAVIQTVSFYFTSRMFYRINLYDYFASHPEEEMIEYLYWYIGDFFSLFVISAFIIKFYLKENLRTYGVQPGDYKFGLKIALLFAIVMLLIIWVISSLPSFSEQYPQLYPAKEKAGAFIVFESALLLYIFAWEFIWRGFMLFGLEEKFGYYAVFIQMIPFVILHNGKPPLETFGAIFGGLALGILALRTRSFYYGVIVHYSVILSIDVISALRFRVSEYGLGLNALINILGNF
ncbi:MAG: CPBP family intramembrane glutamic endopeptidase [Ignavibacteria bacterium]